MCKIGSASFNQTLERGHAFGIIFGDAAIRVEFIIFKTDAHFAA